MLLHFVETISLTIWLKAGLINNFTFHQLLNNVLNCRFILSYSRRNSDGNVRLWLKITLFDKMDSIEMIRPIFGVLFHIKYASDNGFSWLVFSSSTFLIQTDKRNNENSSISFHFHIDSFSVIFTLFSLTQICEFLVRSHFVLFAFFFLFLLSIQRECVTRINAFKTLILCSISLHHAQHKCWIN